MTSKEIFTTGEAAQVMLVSPSKVVELIDEGSLKGHKMPGSNHRRVMRDDLIAFIDQHGLPNPFEA